MITKDAYRHSAEGRKAQTDVTIAIWVIVIIVASLLLRNYEWVLAHLWAFFMSFGS